MTREHLRYFGRTMEFTDNTGEVHAAAFFKPEHFSIDTNNKILYIQLVGYKSIEDFNAGGESLIKKGGSWTKTYTGEAYDRMILLFPQPVAGVALAMWNIADSVKDTPNEGNEFVSFFAGTGEILAPPEMESFFKK